MCSILWREIGEAEGEFLLNLTDEEARALFDQYLGLRDERLALLQQRFNETGGDNRELDFSPDSLVPLWNWAKKQICYRDRTQSELEHIRKHRHAPKEVVEDLWASRHLSEESLMLLNDVAYYFAEVFIRNNPGVRWILYKSKAKRDVDQNQPLLGGFRPPLNPRTVVQVTGMRTLDGEAARSTLADLYNVWLENLSSRPRR